MTNISFKKRYIYTLFFNILNSFISFITSIVIIRYLTPIEYGNYQFLFSIFVAVLTFANLNTQNGYFTFISQKKESFSFYRDYVIWEFIQIFIVLIIVLGIYFTNIVDLFLNQDITLVILALFAVYGTKNIRELITNTFESKRMTTFYLKSTFIINVLNLFLIVIFAINDMLNISIIFTFIILEFFLYLLIAIIVFLKRKDEFIEKNNKIYDFKLNFNRYFKYAKPLFFISLVAATYLFLERWLLQKYGGAEEQAYLALAIQFSTIILILTTSILKIFWKEVAEHIADKNLEVLENIFKNATENIFIITSLISIFFIVNAKEIVLLIYGEKYLPGVIVFMLISFYTIHQTLGQLYGTFMLASEETKSYSYVSIFFSILSIPLMFIAVSPKEIYGLELGALGIAIVMVFIQLLSVNTMGYVIKRKFGFKSIFLFQFKYLIMFGIINVLIYTLLKILDINIFITLLIQLFVLALIVFKFYFIKIKGVFFEKY
ncbi:lipopolysaccharide biosynthesis protein [Aliarcobacter butzleri]|uniref:lipopolysaccharide biosynthesis protein n=1 Tax=Aliarcobacter butzleri TaxID=28197 RepID=UPI00125EE8BA|nr:lipopolysaccharide biosynthesis protein [Aliarcobacter butzleri]MCT7626114.1 lipopolysaccharide biosynthesis protein [Aliarcobacter butzleri]MCT7644167.1 lipopolysaccharide biosynthesis protein [Aliarcobacter butzleri]